MRLARLGVAAATLAALLSAGAATADTGSPVLDRIKERGSIAVGHRDASVPFSYIGEGGKPIGYSIEICMRIVDAVADAIGVEDLPVKFVSVTSQTRIPLMANGTIDLECGSTTNNLTRQQQVDYLPITFITGTKLAVRRDSGIREIEDMDGKVVAISLGSTNERAIKAAAEKGGLSIDYMMVKDHSQGWIALQSGRADAYSTDDVLLYGLVSKAKNPDDYAVVGRFLSYDPYGVMVPRNDSTYRRLGTVVISDMMRSGEMLELYNKWFNPGPTGIGMPPSETLIKAFEIQALPH